MKKILLNKEGAWVETFNNTFSKGVESLQDLISIRFRNENEEENYNLEVKGYFLKAAGQLFEGKTSIDKITVGEIYELFQQDEALKKLANEENIIWSQSFMNQLSTAERNATQYFLKGIEKTKEFILKRFKNEAQEKNFNNFDQTLFLVQIKKILSGNITLSNIDQEDKSEFINAFSTDEILLELQKNLNVDVVGDHN